MKKAIGIIHLWLGLASGLVVFIISVTGCIYVFEKELKAVCYAERETVEVPQIPVKKSLDELLAVANKTAGKDHKIQNITVSAIPDQTYSFRPKQIRDTTAYTHFGEIVYNHRFYINPYTGAVVKDENTTTEFFTVVLRLHRNLLINRSVGKMIIGISVIIFVITLLSGIVLWWPKNKNAAKQRVWFKWKQTTAPKRKNYDLHNILGFYSMLILLAIALTGLTFSYPKFEESVEWIVDGGVKSPKPEKLRSKKSKSGSRMQLDNILQQAQTLTQAAHTFTITIPEKAKGVVGVAARIGNDIRYDEREYQFDQYTGKLLTSSDFDDLSSGQKLSAMNYDIHVGSVLGLPGKILAFFASLISASLPITGFIIWLGRKKKKAPMRVRQKIGSPVLQKK